MQSELYFCGRDEGVDVGVLGGGFVDFFDEVGKEDEALFVIWMLFSCVLYYDCELGGKADLDTGSLPAVPG